MMQTHQKSPDLDYRSPMIRALRSLRAGDAEVIANAVAAAGGGWSVQACDDYDGYMFLMIEPSASAAEFRPSYLVSGTTEEVDLARIHDDDCWIIGRYAGMKSLAADLTSLLRLATTRSWGRQRRVPA